MRRFFITLLCLSFSGCANFRERLPFLRQRQARVGGVYKVNLDEERLVDLSISKKETGEKRFGIFPKVVPYLEGYIRGLVIDYDDNPVEGVVVRVTDKDKDLPGYDPGISDANGVYRIRFSQPLTKRKLLLEGNISYNPAWQQQYEMIGGSLEPQTKESRFKLFFDQDTGVLGIGEDLPKTIVRKATGVKKETKGDEKKKEPPKVAPPSKPPAFAPKKEDDFFGGFGEFGK